MREQVITPRAGASVSGSRRDASASKDRRNSGGIVQNPARRVRGGKANARREANDSMSAALAYAPLVGKVLLAIVVGVLVFAGYRAAASATFFQLRTVDVGNTSRASEDQIKAIVRRDASRTGVWRADLNAISTDVEKLPWVRSAVVSRVLPDGLRVRVTERVPRAVARTNAGRFMWVDEDAVMLGAMSPTDQLPNFFLAGLDEENGDAARTANQERVQKYLEMSREWDGLSLSNRVSEVNLSDVRDVRAQLAGDDSEIEVRLGAKDFGKRLKTALNVLDEQRHTARGTAITHLDATLDRRVIVGFNSGASQTSSETNNASVDNGADTVATTARAQTKEHNVVAKKQTNLKTETKPQTATHKASESQKKEHVKKRAVDNEAKTETRPRRVG